MSGAVGANSRWWTQCASRTKGTTGSHLRPPRAPAWGARWTTIRGNFVCPYRLPMPAVRMRNSREPNGAMMRSRPPQSRLLQGPGATNIHPQLPHAGGMRAISRWWTQSASRTKGTTGSHLRMRRAPVWGARRTTIRGDFVCPYRLPIRGNFVCPYRLCYRLHRLLQLGALAPWWRFFGLGFSHHARRRRILGDRPCVPATPFFARTSLHAHAAETSEMNQTAFPRRNGRFPITAADWTNWLYQLD